MKSKNALVLGGNGYLGTEFTNTLLQLGFNVLALGSKDQPPELKSFDLIIYAHGSKGYSSDKVENEKFLEKVVFIENNFLSLKSILVSSTRIERDPFGIYSLGRLKAENFILGLSENNVVLRMSNIVSQNMPENSFIGSIINIANKGNLISSKISISPSEKRDYIHKTDLREKIMEVILNSYCGRVRIANYDEVSNHEIIKRLELSKFISFTDQTEVISPSQPMNFDYDFFATRPQLSSMQAILASVSG